jgi:hypothetical protein
MLMLRWTEFKVCFEALGVRAGTPGILLIGSLLIVMDGFVLFEWRFYLIRYT